MYPVNPNHLDVIECWKGLSRTQATELTMWYQFLDECLHNEVREVLSKEVVQDLMDSNEAIEEVHFFARMLECLRSKPQRIVDIIFIDIIDSMMGMFHDRFPNESASFASSWSHFSGGLSLFLHNFLRLQDCFQHSPHGPCLEANFDFQFSRWVLTATGDVAWQPPNIRFLHVPTTRASGETYRITPFVWKEIDSPIRSPSCDSYVDQVEYVITRSPATFTWDPVKRCFNTVIGHPRDGKPRTVETVVMATINTLFPDDVIFERRSRWSMKLDVTPTRQPLTPAENRLPSCETYLRRLLEISSAGSDHETVVHNRPVMYSSPQKRKVSKPEVVDAVTASKRRCRDSMLELDDALSDEELLCDDSFVPRYSQGIPQIAEHKSNDPFVGPQRRRYDFDQPVKIQCDSGYSSSSTSPAFPVESTPSEDAIIADRGSLHQDEILHNYHEFADRRLFKDAGLVTSPFSDSERMAYESIFMEDSDEWSPATDGSSINMDMVMSEQ
ncbi:uncharacterized protein M421DRAFT_420953 [Didymella exigua CBS 183.55]|uniref:Uncharacterized protein n=1 Tax=Didymella exigua CBS 183.55 TaxID=1150837 RepID=A0A6A5RMP9_9PLEO|nr:uncharacterized protein M421DRAFT_420953 [Didymella exigua CBS 183.55]KAF1928408.1 hypothetical protein M421DRAFT_420953 [Didymella exigua CBS 183.55]